MSKRLEDLQHDAIAFASEREWEKFHTIKNLTMAIAMEAAELMEPFIWVDQEEAKKVLETKRQDIEDEVGDILFGLLLFCNRSSINLASAFETKLKKTAKKYPVELCKGKPHKYTEYQKMKHKK